MDKIQRKLVELIDNITALEVCLSNNLVKYADIILYLQYDLPIEDNSEYYKRLKAIFNEIKTDKRYDEYERSRSLKIVLRNMQKYIISIDANENQARIVYKEANDIADEICNRLDYIIYSAPTIRSNSPTKQFAK